MADAGELPEGHVTMLFTDIEGSTVHLRTLGSDYARVLSDQRRILRAAIAAHGGHEMGTEGDSFFVVFPTSMDGVATAIDAQRGLDANDWPGGAKVCIRMGLHAGTLTRDEESYVGLELNRAARIASTAHGAQIVVSEQVRQEIDGRLAGVAFRDLGTHRLKDLPEPEHLHQLVVDGLPDITTPIKSLGAPTNLPTPRSAVVGRAADVENVARLLSVDARLVTLTGPGGVGKTTLSMAVAATLDAQFPAGIYFVELEAARDDAAAWAAIATASGLSEQASSAHDDALAFLAEGRSLLVLDNLEQLPEAAKVVGEILDRTACSVLATSRGPLHLRDEQQYPVEPLPLSPAVSLFEREAQRVRPDFALDDDNTAMVEDICRRVEGLPLAIELVASRVRTLGLDAIARALDRRLALSTRDVDRPDRQRTLTATVAWSYDLLDDDLRSAFARLGVFAGDFTVDAAARVLDRDDLDVLESLADVSLVHFIDAADGSMRVSMLAIVREFALERLGESDVEADAHLAHSSYFAEFAEEAERRLHGAEQLPWADRLTTEHDNLHSAFDWAASKGPHTRELALRIAAALGWFWYTRGRYGEGRAWLERVVADGSGDPQLLARSFQALGVLQQHQGENEAAIESLGRALALSREAGDRKTESRALNSLGVTRWAEGRPDLARSHFEQSVAVAREIDDTQRVAGSVSNLGLVLLAIGDPAAAIECFREALTLDDERGDTWGVTIDRINLGAANAQLGDPDEAHRLVVDVLAAVIDLDDPDVLVQAIEVVAIAAAAAGDARRAVTLIGGADRIRRDASLPRNASDEAYLEREYGPARDSLDRAVAEEMYAAGELLTDEELLEVVRARL